MDKSPTATFPNWNHYRQDKIRLMVDTALYYNLFFSF